MLPCHLNIEISLRNFVLINDDFFSPSPSSTVVVQTIFEHWLRIFGNYDSMLQFTSLLHFYRITSIVSLKLHTNGYDTNLQSFVAIDYVAAILPIPQYVPSLYGEETWRTRQYCLQCLRDRSFETIPKIYHVFVAKMPRKYHGHAQKNQKTIQYA